MISLCVPTRGRPEQFAAMVASAKGTAEGPFEIVAWLDEDDPRRAEYPKNPAVTYGSGPRPYRDGVLTTSGLWSRAWKLATGDIAMLASDDLYFHTPGWDTQVEAAFRSVDDRILLVYGNDLSPNPRPIAPFVSREWTDAVGYFTPPDWPGWFSDTWLWTIAADLRRVTYLSNVRIEHLRPRGAAGVDPTYSDGYMARAQLGGRDALWARFYSPATVARRDAQTARLRAAMTSDTESVPDPLPRWFTR